MCNRCVTACETAYADVWVTLFFYRIQTSDAIFRNVIKCMINNYIDLTFFQKSSLPLRANWHLNYHLNKSDMLLSLFFPSMKYCSNRVNNGGNRTIWNKKFKIMSIVTQNGATPQLFLEASIGVVWMSHLNDESQAVSYLLKMRFRNSIEITPYSHDNENSFCLLNKIKICFCLADRSKFFI